MNALFDKKDAVHCFILSGDDTVSRRRAREEIIAGLEEAAGPCIREHFDPAAESASAFAQRMLTPSLFQETRIVHLRHAQTLSDDDCAELGPVLSGDIPDVYCVIEIDESKKDASRFLKKFHRDSSTPLAERSKYRIAEFERPPDYKIPGWLVDNVPFLIGRRIAKADAEYLADRVGYDLDVLHSELQKVDLYLPSNAPVSRNAIDHVTGSVREMSSFELAAAAGRRDLPRALRIIEGLFSVNVPMPLVVSALARHFWALFRIKKYLAVHPEVGRRFTASKGFKNPDQDAAGLAIGKASGLLQDGEERKVFPVLIKSGIVEQAKGFSEDELAHIIGLLLEFDVGIKTGAIEPARHNLEMLCYRITRVRTAAGAG